jgi:DNA gyrase subunit A
VQWALSHPEATDEELLEALIGIIKGPDFPTHGMIVGRQGIEDAYRTGRGSIRMRAVVQVEENKGRTQLVVTELPYQVNPDNLAEKIAELVRDNKISGISDVRDETSARIGQRLVIDLKRDAVAKVVLNNLYKHTQLQDTFGANMLAIVDGVPRTLRLDQMIRYYVEHQVDVIVRRTRYQLRKAQDRLHVLEGLLVALDYLDLVISLIRNAESADAAREQLRAGLYLDEATRRRLVEKHTEYVRRNAGDLSVEVASDSREYVLSEIQATAILDMQLRRLAALERQRIIDEAAELEARISELEAILASPQRQREIISEELRELVERYGDERRTRIVPFEGEMSIEDLIAQEDVVVTVTRGGYAKRTKTDLYRSQRRGGKGVQGAALREDDIVEHFFVTTTHHTLLFFTNKGRVYRAKAHELPEQARSAKGQHVANILAFGQDERIAEVMAISDYQAAQYLVLATKRGLCKKSALTDFDSNRAGGLIAINLREDDEVIGARLVGTDDDLLLVSRNAQSIRFHADDEQLRPMGRATAGVIGMRFDADDELLSIEVLKPGSTASLLVATSAGFAKRTPLGEYPVQGRGGKGVLTARIVSSRGNLVGALVVEPNDQLYAITSNGGVLRTVAKDVRQAQRQTMGVKLIDLEAGVQVVGVARNAEAEDGDEPADG